MQPYYLLSFKPCTTGFGVHDPAAALFKDGELVFAIEQERLSRRKHAVGEFPEEAIRECLRYEDIDLNDIDQVVLPYDPRSRWRIGGHRLKNVFRADRLVDKIHRAEVFLRRLAEWTLAPTRRTERELVRRFGTSPDVRTEGHHRCHAASAYYPSGFEESLVLTIDGLGDIECLAIWIGHQGDLDEIHSVQYPNSLGHFYAVVTEYLGFRPFNGEYKVMGLAAYGSADSGVRQALASRLQSGREYSVEWLTEAGLGEGVRRLEELLGKRRRSGGTERFDDFYRNVAYEAQNFLEETVCEIVAHYGREYDRDKIALAGGVALNCKMNQRIRELPEVDELFVQPASHDPGLVLGAGYLSHPDVEREGQPVYLGSSYNDGDVQRLLDRAKLTYRQPDDLEEVVAGKLASGEIVGWFSGRSEFGPRALGNRSILADPRSEESRDRVNEFVKNREGWRPFAPAMTVEAGKQYLEGFRMAPYMVETFGVHGSGEDIAGVIHPADGSTRPQVVSEEANPKFYRLIKNFGRITGVEVILNTSFNDHGEPIVNSPKEAIRDFFVMGLDGLAIGPYLVEK